MSISGEIISLLRSMRGMLCTVESCTGGLIASRITDIPGASDVFWGALVTYDDSAKARLAGVSPSLLGEFGAVSRPVSIAMAKGGLKTMHEALAARAGKIGELLSISITGVAGPGGGTAETPVGFCWIAIARKGAPTWAREIRGNPNLPREELKTFFAEQALQLILQEIKKGQETRKSPAP